MYNNFSIIFAHRLSKWYNSNKRDLPWRGTKNPYLIWVSEIILQQTKVVQGYDYYLRFIKNFPTVQSLANADEDSVLKTWQGLGYYIRARNLQTSAKIIRDKYDGIFPINYDDILSLKGVGEYTAAAITSFAFNLPYATVDGNVFRFLSRLFGISTPIDTMSGKKEFTELATELLDKQNPGNHNQAIMEFGALYCVPVSPNCLECCFSDKCIAYNSNEVCNYPVKQGKTKTKDRFFSYIDIRYEDFMFLHKREKEDIWKGLYELPLIETSHNVDLLELQEEGSFKSLFYGTNILSVEDPKLSFKHILSHQKIYANFYQITVSRPEMIEKSFSKIKQEDLINFPVSRLVDRYLTKIN